MSRPTPSALRKRAAAWLPDDDARTPRRDEAVERALEADGAPPEGSLIFALNSWMLALADADDEAFEVAPSNETSELAIVADESCAPLAAFGSIIGARLSGRPVVVFASPSDAALLGSFWSFDKRVRMAASDEVLPADALRVAPDPETCAAALLDGRETEDDYESLAQDVMALGGRGERSVRLILAPSTVSPDAFLAACADLRALLPAESGSMARLRMAAAFAEKSGTPCAYLDDYSLLITRGDLRRSASRSGALGGAQGIRRCCQAARWHSPVACHAADGLEAVRRPGSAAAGLGAAAERHRSRRRLSQVRASRIASAAGRMASQSA